MPKRSPCAGSIKNPTTYDDAQWTPEQKLLGHMSHLLSAELAELARSPIRLRDLARRVLGDRGEVPESYWEGEHSAAEGPRLKVRHQHCNECAGMQRQISQIGMYLYEYPLNNVASWDILSSDRHAFWGAAAEKFNLDHELLYLPPAGDPIQ